MGFGDVLFYFLLAVVGQVLARRAGWFRNAVFEFLFSGSVCGLALLTYFFFNGMRPPALFSAALLYAFICELYLFLFTFVRNSVAVSLLMLLCDAALTQEQMDLKLGPENMVERRLLGMTQAGFLENRDLSYHRTPKGRFLAACFKAMKSVFKTGNL